MLADRCRPLAYIALGATIVTSLALAGCGGAPKDDADASPAVAVRLVRVGSGAPGTLELPARVKAAEEATLTARSGGRISAFPVRESSCPFAPQAAK